MGEKKLDGAGLRGQVAGKTALSTVGKEGKGLHTEAMQLRSLLKKLPLKKLLICLLYGNLPNQSEFDQYSQKLKSTEHYLLN